MNFVAVDKSERILYNCLVKINKYTGTALKVLTALLLLTAFILTFTVSDYYIFNRFGQFNAFFILSQWIKKGGLLLLPLAVFYNKKCCADIAKYVLPVFVIITFFTYGGFFDISMKTGEANAQNVYASINEFIGKTANMSLFFIQNALYLAICALLFVRDGYKVNLHSFVYLSFALIAVMPLNIFENFFNIDTIPADSFLRFKNFTIWHFLAIAALAAFTVSSYCFLKKRDNKSRQDYLVAAAIVLLIQYHSKDSMVMGDGYNVYHTVFACIPLFICNIGVYVAALSVLTKNRVLYQIAFFVHAAGAITVFLYFGRDDMSDYGIFASYSILYFCLTHCLLFALSVLPSALGQYRFKIKDCVIPMIYYCLVIVVATVASGIVSSASMNFSYLGYTLSESEWLTPNYAFTQINPLPIPFDYIPFKIWRCEFYLSYLIVLYVVYVGLFWAFVGAYYGVNYAKRAILQKIAQRKGLPSAETAITDENDDSPRDMP